MSQSLAIVIPYYKPDFFAATLLSLANQTDQRFRVYIGNDASPVDPLPLIKDYDGKFAIKYKYFPVNLGQKSLVSQWARCLDLIEGEQWVLILGDDDLLGHDVVARFHANLPEVEYAEACVIRYATVVINENDERLSTVFGHPKLELPQDFIMRRLSGETRSSLSEYIFKTSMLVQTGFREFPLAWHSDLVAVFECAQNRPIYTINDAIVYFRLSGVNITASSENHSPKSQANFQSTYYLLRQRKSVFNGTQTDKLLDRLEKTFCDNKKNLYFWGQLLALYFSTFRFGRFFRLLGQIAKTTAKKI